LWRADAAVTRAPGVVLAVRVADCLPVLLCDRAGTAIGAAHAGWRGVAAGVIENTVAAMACAPAGIAAWLGPAIGPSAFEVGVEVRDAFVTADADSARAFVPARAGKWLADLYALACRRLARAGVAQISGIRACTFSDARRFFSYRRDGPTGRMGAFIWRTAP
jgi:YfiH family protein